MVKRKKTSLPKTSEEIEILRQNAKVHKIVFEEIKKIAKPWVTWKDINDLCLKICNEYDVLPWFKWVYGFPANVCISINDCVVHWIPSKNQVFKDWDVVKFDFWVKDKVYWLNTDAAFTMIIWDWPHDPEIERFLKITEEALYKWIAKATTWNRVWDIWHAIAKHVESNWYHIIKDLTWHWVWYSLHEHPYIPNYWKPHTWEILKEWMSLAIEPIVWFSSWKIIDKWWFEIYVADGSIWAQFEHTIIVRSGYPEIIV